MAKVGEQPGQPAFTTPTGIGIAVDQYGALCRNTVRTQCRAEFRDWKNSVVDAVTVGSGIVLPAETECSGDVPGQVLCLRAGVKDNHAVMGLRTALNVETLQGKGGSRLNGSHEHKPQ